MTPSLSERISKRDHRVDFLRGLALAMIFINHVPGNLYARFTTSNFGFSDAAEIFVLLAGFASAYAYFTGFSRGETGTASFGALKRALVLYMSHIMTTMMALALFCAAAIFFARPGYVHDMIYSMGLAPVFKDTASALVGMVLLGHQLGYFNILPMYMFFLGVLPVMMWAWEFDQFSARFAQLPTPFAIRPELKAAAVVSSGWPGQQQLFRRRITT